VRVARKIHAPITVPAAVKTERTPSEDKSSESDEDASK